MNSLVSIVLPAYNCEKYIQQTIDSLLQQTYTHFELLIINDGSIDNTTNIINTYTDNRIKHIQNSSNKGLIYSLNKGIELAQGDFIARIDADDICLPQRLQKQVNWLEKNPMTVVVASTIKLIDENNKPCGDWDLDKQNITAKQIKKTMIWQSCIAHPSVMMRTNVIKQYQYATNQKHTEDYDLWMQLLADDCIIEKIAEPLLLYRVHSSSVTGSIHRKKNPFFTNYHTKRKFLWSRITQLKWGLFESKIVFTMCIDGLMGIGKEIKRLVKN